MSESDPNYYNSLKFNNILYSDKLNMFFQYKTVLNNSNYVVMKKYQNHQFIIKKPDLKKELICIRTKANNVKYDSNSIFSIQNQSKLIFEDFFF